MSRGDEHHHAAEAIRVMEQLFLLWTDFET
jgi:hypothetical protein